MEILIMILTIFLMRVIWELRKTREALKDLPQKLISGYLAKFEKKIKQLETQIKTINDEQGR